LTVDETPEQMRRSSAFRGLVIAVLIAAYGWFFKQPGASLTGMFLAGAAMQVLVIAIRKFVPADSVPRALDVLELLVDGATVLVFALGVYGGIVRLPADV